MLIEDIQSVIKHHNATTNHIQLRLEEMQNYKKDNYWGTSVRHYATDGKKRYNEIGTIYLNRRDCIDNIKIFRVMEHELKHLVDNSMELDNILKELKLLEAKYIGN